MLTFTEWLDKKRADGQPHAPSRMKKIPFKAKKSADVRSMEDDLSKDYKGHTQRHGDEGEWVVVPTSAKWQDGKWLSKTGKRWLRDF